MLALSVLGSDVIYSEGAVEDLMETLLQLSGTQTTIILAGELRNGMLSISMCVSTHRCLCVNRCNGQGYIY